MWLHVCCGCGCMYQRMTSFLLPAQCRDAVPNLPSMSFNFTPVAEIEALPIDSIIGEGWVSACEGGVGACEGGVGD